MSKYPQGQAVSQLQFSCFLFLWLFTEILWQFVWCTYIRYHILYHKCFFVILLKANIFYIHFLLLVHFGTVFSWTCTILHTLANCKLEDNSQLLVHIFAQSLKLDKFAFEALWHSGYSVGQAHWNLPLVMEVHWLILGYSCSFCTINFTEFLL